MPCSKEEALVRLFYNVSTTFTLLLLFLFCSSIFLSRLLNFIGSYPIIQRNRDYDYVFSEDEDEVEVPEEEEEERHFHVEYADRGHALADTIYDREVQPFWPHSKPLRYHHSSSEEFVTPSESFTEEPRENHAADWVSVHDTETSESEHDEVAESAEVLPSRDIAFVRSGHSKRPTSPITIELYKSDLVNTDKNYDVSEDFGDHGSKGKKAEINITREEKFLVIAPSQLEAKKFIFHEKDDEEIYGDSCTVGSTSKSSSEWRSSINCRDSGTEDPFSSSSRRSCPKWESYTVFQKYDEEMSFLDRISAQKLQETESLRSIQVNPRSISERIVHKFVALNKTPADIRHNPYNELEAAYVAQICLTWEALNWNYKNFQAKKALHHDFDPGCPARIAQQFQQFQVLLQRYIENEPYEHGRRPEIYARMRLLAPKLLLVPEYRDSDEGEKEDGPQSRISSASFLVIMEDGIRTFMNFLKADKETPGQILAALFKRNKKGFVDPSLLCLMKKVNQKKTVKLKDLRRAGKCLRRRKLKVEEEMEILMGLIDLKVVSRVLRMKDLSEGQLQWCEEKMSKVRVLDRKLQRDSSPLFFPAH